MRLAFNIFNLDSIEALAEAVDQTNLPVFMQVSASTVKYLGAKNLFKIHNNTNRKGLIKLHLDHCNDIKFIKMCIDSGWTSVMADFSNEPIEINIRKLNEIRQYLPKSIGQIEGEVGSIGGAEDGFITDYHGKARIEDVRMIFEHTDIDFLAVGIGNIHGHSSNNSRVDFEHFKLIGREFPSSKLVLHGATGLPSAKIRELKSFCLEKVNFSTELKDIYIRALDEVMNGKEKYSMTKYSSYPKSCMQSYFISKISEFV